MISPELIELAETNVGSFGVLELAVSDYLRIIRSADWLNYYPVHRDLLLSDLSLILREVGSGHEAEGRTGPALEPRSASVGIGGQNVRALVVDDTPDALVTTFRALVGWPGVSVSAWLFERQASEPQEEAFERATTEVLGFRPDIIVMDQHMPPISGGGLIRRITSVSDHQLVFVGNSAAWPEPLNEAGAIGNMEKGRNTKPFAEALDRI